jgi:hypothetical protein
MAAEDSSEVNIGNHGLTFAGNIGAFFFTFLRSAMSLLRGVSRET